MSEEWLWIPGEHGRYEVSNLGRVRSHASSPPRILRTNARGKKQRASVKISGRRSSVARLVLVAFRGQPRSGEVCRHMDGDESNDQLSNLEWGTQLENHHDRVRHGTSFRKLSEGDVRRMRSMRSNGATFRELAEEFGVQAMTAWSVCARRTYAWVA